MIENKIVEIVLCKYWTETVSYTHLFVAMCLYCYQIYRAPKDKSSRLVSTT